MSSVSAATNQTMTGFFIGNRLTVSDTLLNLVNTELPSIGFRRVASLSDTLFAQEALSQSVQIIVVDEAKWADLVMVIPRLREKFPNANLVLSYRKPALARRLMKALKEAGFDGDIGYLPANLQVDCWLSVLRVLVCGERFLPGDLLEAEVQDAAPCATKSPVLKVVPEMVRETEPECGLTHHPHLTERELQVLRAASEGKQNKVIAEELDLSQHTVKLHMHHVMRKLGIHNRTEAAIWFLGQQSEQVVS